MDVSQLPKPHINVLPLLVPVLSIIAPLLPLSIAYALSVLPASVSYLSTFSVIITSFPPTALRLLQQAIRPVLLRSYTLQQGEEHGRAGRGEQRRVGQR